MSPSPSAVQMVNGPACCQESKTAVASFHWVWVWLLMVCVWTGCRHDMTQHSSGPAKRDINAVLADHVKELMAIPGVVGVYVGLSAEQKMPCLRVMLARKDTNLERRIPTQLEGYQVITEVTGEIKPMK